MFTGLVQGVGLIAAKERFNAESRLSIEPQFEMKDILEGESIAVNGVCLTVEKSGGGNFSAYASAETLARTNLARLERGARVNLERALAFGERLGGHLVSGHVDCLASIVELAPAGQSLRIALSFPDAYSAEVVPQGSVALDGISLTVTEAGRGLLAVNVIPDTRKRTNLSSWRLGGLLNMETDMIGKYVRRAMNAWRPAERPAGALDMDFLARNGFL